MGRRKICPLSNPLRGVWVFQASLNDTFRRLLGLPDLSNRHPPMVLAAIVENATKFNHLELWAAPWPEMDENAIKIYNLGLWAARGPKLSKMTPKLTIWKFGGPVALNGRSIGKGCLKTCSNAEISFKQPLSAQNGRK